MVAQKDAQLDKPLDKEAPPTIFSTNLTPEYATAALNLTIDFQRQKQSIANSYILKHRLTLTTVLLAIVSFGYYRLAWIYRRGGWDLVKKSNDATFSVFIFAFLFSTCYFSLASRPTSILRERADSIVKNTEEIFGVDLNKFANLVPTLGKNKGELAKGENTQIIVYRDTPIAIISVLPVAELSSDEEFVVKITGIGIRKVYLKSGILQDLIDWAIKRAQKLNTKKAKRLTVLVEALSVDAALISVLKDKQFQKIETLKLSESFFLNKYGINREIWGVSLNVLKIVDAAGASGESSTVKKRSKKI